MEQFKQFILRHFEKILVVIILMAAFIGTYFVEEKFIILNFYYLPVLTAGYFLGRRMGVLAAVFSILAVLICVLVFPRRFLDSKEILTGVAQLTSWGGFLILVSFMVGSLYEKNEQRVKELKSAYIGVL